VADHDLDRLRELLDAGHDTEDDNGNGWTLLHRVIRAESDRHAKTGEPLHADITAFLLARGADPSVHHLALVLYQLPAGPAKFGAPGGIAVTDSNAMSVIHVVDLSTGNIVKTSPSSTNESCVTSPRNRSPSNPLPTSPRSRTERPDRTTQQEPASSQRPHCKDSRRRKLVRRAAAPICVQAPDERLPTLSMRTSGRKVTLRS
jgi:hypothetical protein